MILPIFFAGTETKLLPFLSILVSVLCQRLEQKILENRLPLLLAFAVVKTANRKFIQLYKILKKRDVSDVSDNFVQNDDDGQNLF